MAPTVSKSDSEYAMKFGVVLTVDQHGIYGDDWDWVARPEKPSWYPNAGVSRIPTGVDARMAVRIVAERMKTGKTTPRGFCVVPASARYRK